MHVLRVLGLCGALMLVGLSLAASQAQAPAAAQEDEVLANTFSIVAVDPDKKEYTIELQTKALSYQGKTFTYFDSAKAVRQ